MKCFAVTRRRGERDYLKQRCIYSELVGLVPPLRGLAFRANAVPPLPRWATVFRPWRDFGDAMSAATGVRGDGMGPASGLRCDATKAASDVAVMRRTLPRDGTVIR